MRLPHWSPEVIIRAQCPDENSKMTAHYLYVESRGWSVDVRPVDLVITILLDTES